LNPAFFAAETESGLVTLGTETVLINLRTGLRQRGQLTNGGALIGRFKVKPVFQTRQSPEQGSYS
jgi:hypothetical protein